MGNKKEKHPLEKSLAVFPLIPQSKQNLVSASDSVSYRAEVVRKHQQSECDRVFSRQQGEDTSLARSNNKKISSNSKTLHCSPTKGKGKRNSDENPYLVTKRKLNLAAKYLPKKSDSLTFKLPPILSSPCSISNKEGKNDHYLIIFSAFFMVRTIKSL